MAVALFLMILGSLVVAAIGIVVMVLLTAGVNNGWRGWFGAVGTLFVLVVQWLWFTTVYNGSDQAGAREARYQAEAAASRREFDEAQCKDTVSAFLMSQGFVKRSLKSPATAVFPSQAVSSTQAGRCKFVVVAYVDSQNSFGALIRSSYVASVEYLPATREWQLKSLNL